MVTPHINRRRTFVATAGALTLTLLASLPASPTPDLRIDQMQVIGSHNSYRPYPSPETRARIQAASPKDWPSLAYGHPPLEKQFARGIRQIEIDVAPDPNGGAYAGLFANSAPAVRAAMGEPGAKVLHIPGVDMESHCPTFRACLGKLRRWSEQHPGHPPMFVLVNTGDAGGARFDAANLASLDDDIRRVMGSDHIITPDDVRGPAETLRAAVTSDHAWPTLARGAGRFMFVLDGSGAHEEAYRSGHPSLRARAMFGFFGEAEAEAAIFNIQDPRAEAEHIRHLVAQGFLVRTRADEGLAEPRAHDGRRLAAAIASGAQWISSDLYEGASNPEHLVYRAAFPGGALTRCNPATATCR
ncbi:Ca2+-dependent phosphoinositide-specific phospholipase C [Sphingomonas xinjiangensis]|uniref:Calcium-dependent phosphoinositide phospholipase C n=1 Tax=Sphingomonas xinjiangensis TaxID=643568 RepID=A0A840YKS3_9SPHN|nr:Ca2+-dependent phosphoinositide-specific phospholipase C [Sphingomonas xinjiangensis]MBB5711808.1 hypothetical protein [Sphingomonas xinjiangensis]